MHNTHISSEPVVYKPSKRIAIKNPIVNPAVAIPPVQELATFESLGIAEPLSKVLTDVMKFDKPSPIQTMAIPSFLEGKSMIIADQTGSGKTLAYLLPMLERLHKLETDNRNYKRRGQRTRALIVVLNRELALQIEVSFSIST